jgi:Spy/CpxP family protein refolding chaperone
MRDSAPVLVVIGGLTLAACDKDSTEQAAPAASASATPVASATPPPMPAPSASATAQEDPVADELRDYHRHHHHGGVAAFIAMAADTLGLDPAKKAQVEQIETDLRAKMAPARDAEHDVLATIADGVAAGKVDGAKVDAQVAKVAAASAGIHTASADALTKLHDTLSPVERNALADKVLAHWEVWQKVNAEEKAASHEKGTHLARLTELLALTPDQVAAIEKSLGAEPAPTPQTDPKPVDAYVQAFATAFRQDKFDPKTLNPQATASAGHIARHGDARMARFYEAIAPVLTPDQRTKLATHLRERLDDQVASTK